MLTMEKVARMAVHALLSNGEHYPLIIAECEHQRLMTHFTGLPPTARQRQDLLYALGQTLAQDPTTGALQAAFFINEAWASVVPVGQSATVPPSADPHRREILIVCMYSAATQMITSRIFDLLRYTNGDLYDVGPGRDTDDVSSPLIDAFVRGFHTQQAE